MIQITNCNYELDVFGHLVLFDTDTIKPVEYEHQKAQLIENLTKPYDYQKVLCLRLLPEQATINSSCKTTDAGTYWSHSQKLQVQTQTEEVKEALSKFLGKKLVVLAVAYGKEHLYGTTSQPLLFQYKEINSNKPSGLQGYELEVAGNTYFEAIHFAAAPILSKILNILPYMLPVQLSYKL